jgi:hypothetical protein
MSRIADNSAPGFPFPVAVPGLCLKDRSRTGRKPVTSNKPKLGLPLLLAPGLAYLTCTVPWQDSNPALEPALFLS